MSPTFLRGEYNCSSARRQSTPNPTGTGPMSAIEYRDRPLHGLLPTIQGKRPSALDNGASRIGSQTNAQLSRASCAEHSDG